MRSAKQIGRTVSEWHDYQRAQRAKLLRELLAALRQARESDAEWYRWIASGRPVYSEAEYAAVLEARKRR